MRDVRAYLGCPEEYPTGAGVRIALIDSGVDHTHPDLEGAVLIDQCRDCSGMDDWRDRSHHGTHLAGLLAGRGPFTDPNRCRGIAPDAQVFAIRVETDGRVSEFDLLKAFDAAEDLGAEIINLSLTLSPADLHEEAPWAWSTESLLNEKLKTLAEHGILCVVAAGNDGPALGTINFPGGAEEVVTVGASDLAGSIHPQSSRGPFWIDPELMEADFRTCAGIAESVLVAVQKPDLVVPGVEICGPHSRDCGRPENTCNTTCDQRIYVKETGTSQAAAVATGLAACALQILKERQIAPLQRAVMLRHLMVGAAKQEPGSPESYGAGILRWPALQIALESFLSDLG